MSSNQVKVTLSTEVQSVMEERGVCLEDIQTVIDAAETSGVKLLNQDSGHFLAKKRLENVTVYAEYQINGDQADVIDVYSHRVMMAEDQV